MHMEMKNEDLKIELRKLTKNDYLGLKASMVVAYSDWQGASFWGEAHIGKLVEIFPEGQICILVNGVIAGCALSLIVDYDKFGDNHTYTQITGNYTFSTHNPNEMFSMVSTSLYIRTSAGCGSEEGCTMPARKYVNGIT